MANNPEISIIVVTDEKETRQMAIFCDNHSRDAIMMRQDKCIAAAFKEDSIIANPISLTDRLLPEVLCTIIKYLSNIQLSVVITHVCQGRYHAVIEDTHTGTTFPVRVSDGILLTLADKHIPLSIDENLWLRQSIPYTKDSPNLAIPINAISHEMLITTLEKAIENEEYETAQRLKEELDRRKNK